MIKNFIDKAGWPRIIIGLFLLGLFIAAPCQIRHEWSHGFSNDSNGTGWVRVKFRSTFRNNSGLVRCYTFNRVKH